MITKFVTVLCLCSMVISSVSNANIYSKSLSEKTFLKIDKVTRDGKELVRYQQCYVANPNDCLLVGNRVYNVAEIQNLKAQLQKSSTLYKVGAVALSTVLVLGVAVSTGYVGTAILAAGGGGVGESVGTLYAIGGIFSFVGGVAETQNRIDHYNEAQMKRLNKMSGQALTEKNISSSAINIDASMEDFIAVLDYQLSSLD